MAIVIEGVTPGELISCVHAGEIAGEIATEGVVGGVVDGVTRGVKWGLTRVVYSLGEIGIARWIVGVTAHAVSHQTPVHVRPKGTAQHGRGPVEC